MFFAWQVNFTLSEHGRSTVPFWFSMLVTVLVSTVGVDAVVVSGAPTPYPTPIRSVLLAIGKQDPLLIPLSVLPGHPHLNHVPLNVYR